MALYLIGVWLIVPVMILGIVESFSDWLPRRRVKDPDVEVDLLLIEMDELIKEVEEDHRCDVCGRVHWGTYPTCGTCLEWANSQIKPASTIIGALCRAIGLEPAPEPMTIWEYTARRRRDRICYC
jgi:hypothetical protein